MLKKYFLSLRVVNGPSRSLLDCSGWVSKDPILKTAYWLYSLWTKCPNIVQIGSHLDVGEGAFVGLDEGPHETLVLDIVDQTCDRGPSPSHNTAAAVATH